MKRKDTRSHNHRGKKKARCQGKPYDLEKVLQSLPHMSFEDLATVFEESKKLLAVLCVPRMPEMLPDIWAVVLGFTNLKTVSCSNIPSMKEERSPR
jgi:hypothetical protein